MQTETELRAALRLIESREAANFLQAAKTIEQQILNNAKLFCQLQDSFAYNVAGRLADQLPTVLTKYSETERVLFLRLLRGVCLVHRPSRGVFDNDECLMLLLGPDGLKSAVPEVQIASVDTIVAILVRQVSAIRRFETLGGLKVVCEVFKHSKTPTAVKLALIQFLFFYLVPETRTGRPGRKTTKDKQEMLAAYLSNVDGLVRELETNKPFGETELEW